MHDPQSTTGAGVGAGVTGAGVGGAGGVGGLGGAGVGVPLPFILKSMQAMNVSG